VIATVKFSYPTAKTLPPPAEDDADDVLAPALDEPFAGPVYREEIE
jgi:hypothetical protein